MKPRVLYEVDPHNRLILKRAGAKGSKVKRFRTLVRGRFRTDGKNRLYYEVFKSSGKDVPQKIEFSGNYSLDKRHNLILTLNKWSNQCQGNRLRLRTKFIHADGSEAVFLLRSRVSEKMGRTYIMRLHGSWQADKNNRLRFGVKKEGDKTDGLTLFKAWKLNKNNEIVYSQGRDSRIITLKGHWLIRKRYRLGYILDKGRDSGFNFRTSLGQVVGKGKKTYVSFGVTIAVSKNTRIKRKIIFTARCKPGRGEKIILELSPCGRSITLKLAKEILNQKGLAYIESLFKDRERYFGAGAAFRW